MTADECPDVKIASVVDGSTAAAAATAETRVSTTEPILLELFNPIADADEIIYDSSKECAGDDVDLGAAASEHDTANGHGTDEQHCPSPLSPTASPATSPAANHSFLSLVLRAMGGCLLRPRRRSNESATSAPPGKGPNVPHLSPKRKGIRGRLQLIQSRSSSSDNSDPVTATTSVGERNLSSGGSGDSADNKSSVGRSSKVVAHTNEYCDCGSASEAYNVSYHELDDDTIDGASYAFSQAAGISEEAKVEVDIGSVVARIGVDLSNASTEGGNDAISILFDDEDEDEAGDDLLAISVGECGSSESPSISENSPADELDYIRPLFTHQSLRQASEKRTSYDFVIDEDESDECLCKVSQVDVDSTSQKNEE